MKFSVTEHIKAPRAEVLNAMGDPGYYESLGGALTSLERPQLLSSTTVDGQLSLHVRYAFSGDVAGPVRMAVDPDKLTWVISTDVDLAAHRGRFTVVPDFYGSLLTCEGTVAYDEGPDGTLETVSGDLTVNIPLLGGTAEKAILGGFTQHLETEAEALAAYCSAIREA